MNQEMIIRRAAAASGETRQTVSAGEWTDRLERTAGWSLRYGLAIVIAWIGAMKFTAYEAEGIAPFVANSPLMGWTYRVFTHGQFSALLGVVELLVAALIAAKSVWPRASALGALAAVGMFTTTLSFMATTPGVIEPAAGGFPALSALPGQFLIKDVALLAIALWLLADGLRAIHTRSETVGHR